MAKPPAWVPALYTGVSQQTPKQVHRALMQHAVPSSAPIWAPLANLYEENKYCQ